jgi:hypothetical protein
MLYLSSNNTGCHKNGKELLLLAGLKNSTYRKIGNPRKILKDFYCHFRNSYRSDIVVPACKALQNWLFAGSHRAGKRAVAAMRAKILFTEGVHIKSRSRPKFERRRELTDPGRGTSFYGVPPGHIGKVIFNDDHQHRADGAEINYGAHIPTIIDLMESGRL